jgi:hypothetical protein
MWLVWITGKVAPQHTMEAQRERTYSPYSFKTSVLDGGEWSASRPDRAFPPGKGPPVPTEQEAISLNTKHIYSVPQISTIPLSPS